jgi:hypothetical protein
MDLQRNPHQLDGPVKFTVSFTATCPLACRHCYADCSREPDRRRLGLRLRRTDLPVCRLIARLMSAAAGLIYPRVRWWLGRPSSMRRHAYAPARAWRRHYGPRCY